MYFETISSLIHMDGHGTFVWGTYGLGLLVIAYNIASPLLVRKKVVSRIKRQMARA